MSANPRHILAGAAILVARCERRRLAPSQIFCDPLAVRDLGAALTLAISGLVATFLILALDPAWEGARALALAW
jgi:hypothetical protein